MTFAFKTMEYYLFNFIKYKFKFLQPKTLSTTSKVSIQYRPFESMSTSLANHGSSQSYAKQNLYKVNEHIHRCLKATIINNLTLFRNRRNDEVFVTFITAKVYPNTHSND